MTIVAGNAEVRVPDGPICLTANGVAVNGTLPCIDSSSSSLSSSASRTAWATVSLAMASSLSWSGPHLPSRQSFARPLCREAHWCRLVPGGVLSASPSRPQGQSSGIIGIPRLRLLLRQGVLFAKVFMCIFVLFNTHDKENEEESVVRRVSVLEAPRSGRELRVAPHAPAVPSLLRQRSCLRGIRRCASRSIVVA